MSFLTTGLIFLFASLIPAFADCDPDAPVTFEKALVNVPAAMSKSGAECYGTMDNPSVANCLSQVKTNPDSVLILFMHGCDGMNLNITDKMRKLGYLYVAPKSFRRPNRVADCTIQSDKKPIMKMRMDEVRYAYSELRKNPNLKNTKFVLMGFSEGASTTSLFPEDGFEAKIILGWSCHSSDPWWNGIRGKPNLPVLAIEGSLDKYHQNPSNAGDCGTFIKGRPHSTSIVVPGDQHDDIQTRDLTWIKVGEFLSGISHNFRN